MALKVVWDMAEKLLPKATAAKITILGTDYQDHIKSEIAPEMLPEQYGGTRASLSMVRRANSDLLFSIRIGCAHRAAHCRSDPWTFLDSHGLCSRLCTGLESCLCKLQMMFVLSCAVPKLCDGCM